MTTLRHMAPNVGDLLTLRKFAEARGRSTSRRALKALARELDAIGGLLYRQGPRRPTLVIVSAASKYLPGAAAPQPAEIPRGIGAVIIEIHRRLDEIEAELEKMRRRSR